MVLIQFWTFSCINSLRALPYAKKWHETYKDKGFAVIGVHTPEFAFEKETSNVETAIKSLGVTYPVPQDNQYSTWKAYRNYAWPAEYLIDKSGKILAIQFGEGNYGKIGNAIARLMGPSAAGSFDCDRAECLVIRLTHSRFQSELFYTVLKNAWP